MENDEMENHQGTQADMNKQNELLRNSIANSYILREKYRVWQLSLCVYLYRCFMKTFYHDRETFTEC